MGGPDHESSDRIFQRLSPRALLSRGLGMPGDSGAPTPTPAPAAAGSGVGEAGLAELFPEYQFLGLLNRGGFGAVYRVEHRSLRRPTALKILASTLSRQLPAVVRFEREIAAVGGLEHPGIVRAFDAGQRGEVWYLAMELVDGVDFGALVRQTGPLAPGDASELIRQAALALHHAHERGFVHRDVKPGNLMLSRDREGRPLVKVLDFGLTQLTEQAGQGVELTVSGEVLGTVDYIAPEQIVDPRSVDARADVYGLGATFYRLLTGRTPHGVDESSGSLYSKLLRITREPCPGIAGVRPELPAELAAVVDRMLALEPGDRYSTAGEVAAVLEPLARPADLAALLARAPQPVSPAGTVERAAAPATGRGSEVRPGWRRPLILGMGVALLLALVAGSLAWREWRRRVDEALVVLPGLVGTPWLEQPRGITLGRDGAFYGGAIYGGARGHGAIYRFLAPTTIVSVVDFTGRTGSAPGRMPGRQLLQARDGMIYGVTEAGGAQDRGTVFRFDPRSSSRGVTTLVEFDGVRGGNPLAGLVEDRRRAGVFYGGTQKGGRHGHGVVFRISTGKGSPQLDVLAEFSGRSGEAPGHRLVSALVQDEAGHLYGTTPEGGAHDGGTVFRLTTGGQFELLANFGAAPLPFTNPTGGLTPGKDGNFYGHCFQQRGGNGAIFRVSPDGRVEGVAEFAPELGLRPASTMYLERDGSLVGTTQAGGAGGQGTVFRFDPRTGLSKVADFPGVAGTASSQPWAMPVRGADGKLYGATEQGGTGRRGTLYRVTPRGEVTVLVEFVEPPRR